MKTLWTSELFIMAVLCLTSNADNEGSNCEEGIKVRRNTVYEASLGEILEIECPVHFCNDSPATITWFKLETDFRRLMIRDHVRTERTYKNNAEVISFLIFNNVRNSDLGQYQCQHGIDVSHVISVTIKGDIVNLTIQEQTNSTTVNNQEDNRHIWLYVYSAAGIGGIVIIVIVISVLAMRGCGGKAKKVSQHESQYMDIPMVEQPIHHSSNQALPRGSPREPPSHRTSRKKKSPSPAMQRDNLYGQIEGDRETQRSDPVEEGSSVVYAALNHQQLTAATPRSRMVVEERSEYAAIRIS